MAILKCRRDQLTLTNIVRDDSFVALKKGGRNSVPFGVSLVPNKFIFSLPTKFFLGGFPETISRLSF